MGSAPPPSTSSSRDGWSVVAVDVCADDPQVPYPLAAQADLDGLAARHGGAVATLVGDVRSQDDMDAAVALARDRFGGLDAAVAAAGVVAGGPPVWEADDDQWHALFDVNLTGVAAARPGRGAFAPRRNAAPSGSASSRSPRPPGSSASAASAAYVASKHAVIGLVRALAADLAGTGVTANAVCPGSTRTPILEASARIYGLDSVEDFDGHQLLERLLEPEEPAALIAWLCGPQASGVTGAVLAADGGMTAF